MHRINIPASPVSKKEKDGCEHSRNSSPDDLLMLLSLFVLLLIIFSGGASASIESVSSASIESGAQAIATGDTVFTFTQSVVTENGASSSATAKAVASNGGIATAIANAWANFKGMVCAGASSTATASSNAGETVYAYAHTEVSVSSEGYASSISVSRAGTGTGDNDGGDGDNGENDGGNDGDNGDNGENDGGNDGDNGENGENDGGNDGDNGDNGENDGDNGDSGSDNPGDSNGQKPIIIKPKPLRDNGFFGFAFGWSDPGRYYYFKRVVAGDNATGVWLSDKDSNMTYIRARARYYMWVIPNDRGLNQTQFENKYREENYTVEIGYIIKEMRGIS